VGEEEMLGHGVEEREVIGDILLEGLNYVFLVHKHLRFDV